MSTKEFDKLLGIVGPKIEKLTTTYRRPISAAERLAVTLRFLATGDSYRTIANGYRLGISTVSLIVPDTCRAIWDTLQPMVLQCPFTQAAWTTIGNDFEARWQFPNCLGAIDGKHVIIQAPNNSGSMFFNYKKTHSIVLMAVVDANYKFVAVDVGGYGRSSDGGIFADSCFGRRLANGTPNLPNPRPLGRTSHGDCTPFVFVADEAFPLKENIMRPYGGNNLNSKQKIYNYRLSRARRMVESVFGILSNQWRVFHVVMPLQPTNADGVVKATCCLHNFLRKGENQPERVQEASSEADSNTLLRSLSQIGGRATSRAIATKESYTDFFSGQGAIGWQNDQV
uniref:protein ALP1-like n=1 Tax=Styela clava TaxID=7725 RepID=UPI001939C2E9|nr:protein ALP1-like [Styela clava]